jgi:hypothetical protein
MAQSNITPIRFPDRQTIRQRRFRPSRGTIRVNCVGMNSGVETSSEAPAAETSRTEHSIVSSPDTINPLFRIRRRGSFRLSTMPRSLWESPPLQSPKVNPSPISVKTAPQIATKFTLSQKVVEQCTGMQENVACSMPSWLPA